MNVIGFVLRWLGALVLVLGTYNPTPYNFARWVLEAPEDNLPIKVVVGLLILIGFVIYVRAAVESLGRIGLLLATALVAALIWWLSSEGLLSADPGQPMLAWIVLVAIATILALGMSWSFLRQRVTGQIDTV